MKAGRCRSCPAPVAWVETENGKAMLVDAGVEAFGGTGELEDQRGLLYPLPNGRYAVVKKATEPAEVAGRPMYRSHFATCTRANEHRRR